jgi:hypothetical protein
MTEAEWLETERIGDMLEFVCERPLLPKQPWHARLMRRPPPAPVSPRVSDRKLRLFACACCRWIWNRIDEDWGRHAVETAERHADSLATDDELKAVHEAAIRSFERALPILQTGRAVIRKARWKRRAVAPIRTCERVPRASAIYPPQRPGWRVTTSGISLSPTAISVAFSGT